MGTGRRPLGFTVIELLVVISVIAILAAIIFPVFSSARRAARSTKCSANLAQIVTAAKMYQDDHRFPPGGDLPVELADYVDSPELFVCPEDRGGTDSYSGLYVSRPTPTDDQYVIGCAFHGDKHKTIMSLGKADTSKGTDVTILHDGVELDSGDIVTGGTVEFADGSRLTVGDGMDVGIVAAAANRGRAYNIVYVPSYTRGTLVCDSAEGSAFEVVTPSAIAGVRNTSSFIVQVGVFTGNGRGHAWGTRRQSSVHCTSGEVLFEDRFRSREKRLAPGETAYMTLEFERLPKDPNWPPGKGGGNGNGKGSGKGKN